MFGTQPARADDSWIFSNWRFAAYAGPVTHTSTFQIFSGHADFDQGGLGVLALSREMFRLGAGFSLEAEGQFGQHFAQLHEQEFNLLLGLRYSDFGWSDRLLDQSRSVSRPVL